MVALRSPVLDAQPLQRSDRAVDVLAELAARLPAWHLEAACRGEDSALPPVVVMDCPNICRAV